MTTYNTYQEAKMAHPESKILTRNGYFCAIENIASSQINKWNDFALKEVYKKVKNINAGDRAFVFVHGSEVWRECLVIAWHPERPILVVESGYGIGTATFDELHQKVTKPIEWWEDACEHVKDSSSDDWELEVTSDGKVMRMTAEMTRDQWCDFARILLEQEDENKINATS